MLLAKGTASLLSLVWVFICVLLIIGLAYVFTKYIVGRGKLGRLTAGKDDIVKILARVSVSKDGQLLLAQLGERFFLLGNTTSGITKLAEFTPEEAQAWKSTEDPSDGGQPPSFGEALRKVWKQKVKR